MKLNEGYVRESYLGYHDNQTLSFCNTRYFVLQDEMGSQCNLQSALIQLQRRIIFFFYIIYAFALLSIMLKGRQWNKHQWLKHLSRIHSSWEALASVSLYTAYSVPFPWPLVSDTDELNPASCSSPSPCSFSNILLLLLLASLDNLYAVAVSSKARAKHYSLM